jgi:hypothetical protein
MLEAIGLALGGRAGARLAAAVGVVAGRATLLRLVRALPEPVLIAAPSSSVWPSPAWPLS